MTSISERAAKKRGAAPAGGGTNLLTDFAIGLGQGLTSEFGDELFAAVEAGLDDGLSYDEALEKARGRISQANPYAKVPGEVIGAILSFAIPAGWLGRAAQVATKAPKAYRAMQVMARSPVALGAAEGALTGFGAGEGGIAERAETALTGALTGAAGGKLGQMGADAVTRTYGRLASPAARGRASVLRRAQQDDITPDLMRTEAARLGPEGRLVDIEQGKNLRGLGGTVTRKPGAAGRRADAFLEGRVETTRDTLSDVVSGMAGRKSRTKSLADLTKAQKEAAQPLYDAFYKSGPVNAARLEQMADQIPVVGAAARRARRTGGTIDFSDPKFVDRMYKRLGDEGSAAYRAGRSSESLDIADIKAQFAEAAGPTYKQAVKAFAGPAAVKDAFEAGGSFARKEADQIAAELAELPPKLREAYRQGAGAALLRKMDDVTTGADASAPILKNRTLKRQVQALAGSVEEYQSIMTAAERAQNAALRRNQLRRGSQTAERSAEDAYQSQFIPLATEIRDSGMVRAGTGRMAEFLMDPALSERARDEAGRLLFETPLDRAARELSDPLGGLLGTTAPPALRGGAAVAGGQQGGDPAPAVRNTLRGLLGMPY